MGDTLTVLTGRVCRDAGGLMWETKVTHQQEQGDWSVGSTADSVHHNVIGLLFSSGDENKSLFCANFVWEAELAQLSWAKGACVPCQAEEAAARRNFSEALINKAALY